MVVNMNVTQALEQKAPILSGNQKSGVPAGDEQKMRDVSRKFEALFTSYLLKSMDKTVQRNNLMNNDFEQGVYRDMLYDEYARIMSQSRTSLGLADLIYKSLRDNQEQKNDLLESLGDARTQSLLMRTMQSNGMSPMRTFEVKNDPTTSLKVEQYDDMIRKAAQEYLLDPNLIKAMIHQESSGEPMACSRAGAKGLMQLMDSTANDMEVANVYNPAQNIMGGARYLRGLLDACGQNENLALASYNAGPAVVERYKGVPPFPETKNYVKQVQLLKSQYAASRH